MPDRVASIGLDNPVFAGRLRQPRARQLVIQTRPTTRPVRRGLTNGMVPTDDIRVTPPQPQQKQFMPVPQQQTYPDLRPQLSPPEPVHIAPPMQNEQQFIEPVPLQQSPPDPSIQRRILNALTKRDTYKLSLGLTKLQLGLIGMAALVFVIGIATSVQTVRTNHEAAAQVAALARKANNNTNDVVPSTVKPSAAAVSNYVVAPNLPRYLKIPKLGVDARVLQTGVTSTGALGTPPNVYDTAWYTGSAEPGQPGATLIDGHVSSWTAHGVFYGLKTLAPGDTIQIVRGDGTVFNYQVMKTQVYSANNVNMQAAMTPITPGVPGLNLITCTGDVIPGTSLFNERIIVFAQQV